MFDQYTSINELIQLQFIWKIVSILFTKILKKFYADFDFSLWDKYIIKIHIIGFLYMFFYLIIFCTRKRNNKKRGTYCIYSTFVIKNTKLKSKIFPITKIINWSKGKFRRTQKSLSIGSNVLIRWIASIHSHHHAHQMHSITCFMIRKWNIKKLKWFAI